MQESPPQIAKAATWMIGAILSFSAMAVSGREAGLSLDTFEIMTYRSAIGFVLVCVVLSATGSWSQVRMTRWPQHLLRNMFHFTGQNLWFFAVTAVPLAQVFALEFTSPIWVILLAPLLLGEKLTRARMLAVLLGFGGILIVARPSPDTFSIGLAAAAACAIFFALTGIATKRLTRFEQIGSIMFWLTGMQLVFGLACAGWDGDMALPDSQNLIFLVIIGCAGLAAHYCITSALALAPAVVVMPIDFARLPAIALIGWLIYGEAVDIWLLLGGLLILAGNAINIASARHNAR